MEEAPLSEAMPLLVRIRLYVVLGCVYVSIISLGAASAYSSPAIPDMKSARNKFTVSDEEGAIIGSIYLAGAILGSILTGPCTRMFGYKTIIMYSIACTAIGWLFIICANGVALIYIGRIITGACFASGIIVPQLYVSDISTARMRGIMVSLGSFMVNLGTLYTYSLGIVLNWRWLAVGIQAISLLAITAFTYVPESPRWSYLNGRIEEATDTLKWLRGDNADTLAEINAIKNKTEKQKSAGAFSIKDLSDRFLIFPVTITISVCALQQFTGVSVLTINLSEILAEANSSLDPNQQSVIVAVIEILGMFPLFYLIDRLGRRIALFTSFAISVAMLVILGLNDVLKERDPQYPVEKLSWLPILCISVYKFAFSIGAPIPFLMMVEMYPSRGKALACGFTLCIYFALSFLVPSIYIYITKAVGYYGMYWIFAGIGAVAIVFVYFVIPETKGKSLEEIEEIMAAEPQNITVTRF